MELPSRSGSSRSPGRLGKTAGRFDLVERTSPAGFDGESRQNNPGHWEQLRTDLYAQAQGIVTPDFASFTGDLWYQVELPLSEPGPGEFAPPLSGLVQRSLDLRQWQQVAHREFKGVWWMNDYRFEFDADVTGKLQEGSNSLVVRLNNPHHFGGLFRRPFVYRAL